jgi:hypothetical protein
VDVAAKRLQLLKEIAPSIVRVAVLFNPLSAGAVAIAREIEKASPVLAIDTIQNRRGAGPHHSTLDLGPCRRGRRVRRGHGESNGQDLLGWNTTPLSA